MRIETERTILRAFVREDSEALFAYRSDAITNRFQGWIPKDLDAARTFISKLPKSFNIPKTWYQLAIVEKKSNRLIGDIGVHFIGDDNQQCELGCTLNKLFHGKGFATEAMNGVIDYLFTTLDKHRIVASIDPQNTSSIKMVERLGFRKEGHFVESLFMNGKWVDDVVYGMLRWEWEKTV